MLKKCTRCHEPKDFSEFNKCKTGKYSLHNHCRLCQKEYRLEYYASNKQKFLDYATAYSKSPIGITLRKARYLQQKGKLLAKNRQYRNNDRARKLANVARKKKYDNDIGFKLAHNLRTRVRKALKGLNKSEHTLKLIGCSIVELKIYLENKFLPGMTWDNYSYRGWHIDHIIPCASFNLSDPAEQAKCFHYTNLQPLWMEDNISKSASSDCIPHRCKSATCALPDIGNCTKANNNNKC